MLRPRVFTWIFVLTAVVQPVYAANTLEGWEKCMEAASSGPEALEIERDSGVDGLHEHALAVCGFRPTTGGKTLAKEDCDRLFDMAPEIACEISSAGGAGDRYLKTLDPRVFDEDRYWVLCHNIQTAEPAVSRQQFGREICGERPAEHGAQTDKE